MSLPLDLTCPACGVAIAWVLEGPLNSAYPQICIGCRALLVLDYRPSAHLRYPTDREENVMLTNPHVLKAINEVAEYHRREGPPMSHPADGDPT